MRRIDSIQFLHRMIQLIVKVFHRDDDIIFDRMFVAKIADQLLKSHAPLLVALLKHNNNSAYML
ncbi:hypothetical protein D3C71_1796240 [compost metagenome]